MINILPFCMGMLITYYTAAVILKGVYSVQFIIAWTIFALICPVLAYFTWMTKEKGVFPKIISCGIVTFSVLTSVIIFDRLRIYDFIIDGLLIYFLFFKKVKR